MPDFLTVSKKIASASEAESAKTAGNMAIPANRDAVLLPNAPIKVFKVTSSLSLEKAEIVIINPQPAPVDHAD